jgi:deoxyribodipyrimidine photolyase-like uncharacterized protein
MNIMRENIKLISEIGKLRKEVKALESQLKSHNSKAANEISRMEGGEQGEGQDQEANNFN